MMLCPICDKPTEVYDSRTSTDLVRRRRRCPNGHRFNTSEKRTGRPWVVPDKGDNYDGAELEKELAAELGG